MRFTIIDCYTDEPAGLGVPPYIGTYPRYIAGAIIEAKQEVFYLTIDDIRFYQKNKEKLFENGNKNLIQKNIDSEKEKIITNIKIKNLSKNIFNIKKILETTEVLVIISGVHTPGKYLSAYPGTTKEIEGLLDEIGYKGFRVLTGPNAYSGSGLYGGKKVRETSKEKGFDLIVKDMEIKVKELIENKFSEDVPKEYTYDLIKNAAIVGSDIVKQYPDELKFLIAEIETGKGCARKKGCSFCTEPIKYCGIQKRDIKDIIDEIKALNKVGVLNFRFGKQSCFYSYGTDEEVDTLLKNARKYADILHIDNANPQFVNEEKTKSIVKYCTPGNIAAFGVESFDEKVIKANNLNSNPEQTYKAVKIINKYGNKIGQNGMHIFLPGLNLLFGLINESKKTHEENMFWLKKMLDENLLIRRINVRQVVAFPGTEIYNTCKDKFIKKNKKYYWKWRNDIRQNVDLPMLKKLFLPDSTLKGLRAEIYDGNTTFLRQIGTYPIIVGVKERLKLDEFYDVKIKDYMLRSLVGEKVR